MVDSELLELKREFLGEAAEKAQEIRRILDGERDADSIERLVYLAHQLKGSGGSYGYQDISDEAAAIEKAVEQSDAGAKLNEHGANLSAAIERAQSELASA
jgi:HPt (histidine-containing phosphotransfer) domain-containing protein